MKRRIAKIVAGVLVVALVLVGVLAASSLASRWLTGAAAGRGGHAAVLSVAATPVRNVSGSYTGHVQLEGAYAGTLNDAGVMTPMPLGNVEFALELLQTGDVVSGFVALENTLVFTREHVIMVTPAGPTPLPGTPPPTPHARAIGPYVGGQFGEKLVLMSHPADSKLSGREIRRQFSLESTSVLANGAQLAGVYRETLWGYSSRPSTLVGKFYLERPVFGAPAPTATASPPPNWSARLYLPMIRK